MLKNLILNFIKSLSKIRNRILFRKNKTNLTAVNSADSKMSKSRILKGINLTLNNELKINRQKVLNEVKEIVQNNSNNFINIFEFTKKKGVPFYYLKNAEKILKFINEKPGLIFQKKGVEAFYLNLITSKKISFKTPVMFIFDKNRLNDYSILYNFYKWYAYYSKLPGFEEKTLAQFKNIYEHETNLDGLTYEEIVNLKHAIQRDKEAADFALNFMKNLEGSKKAFNILKSKDNGASI